MQKKILVVEDEHTLLNLYASVLERGHNGYSFEVHRAGNYEEAVLLSEEHRFDVLLTDYHLPGKDGISLIKKMKQKDASIACVIISGYLSSDISKAAKDAGAFTCLKKPCSIYLIIGTIEKAMRYHSTHLETVESEDIPLSREVQCLIDNYPNETAFIDNTMHILAGNASFKNRFPRAIDSTCHKELFGRTIQCPQCPILNEYSGDQLLVKDKLLTDESITMRIEKWQDRDGIQRGYIISCVPPDETEETVLFEEHEDAYHFFALDKKGIITHADPATTSLFSNGKSVIGVSINQYLHSYFIQHLKKESISFTEYAEQNRGRQISLDFITADSLERKTLRCEFRINEGAFPENWKVIVIGVDTASKNDISRLIEFGKETFQQLKTGQFDMVFTIGRNLIIKTVNRVALSKLRARQKDIVGSSIKNLLFTRRDTHAFGQAVQQVQTLKNVYNLRLDIGYTGNKIAALINMSAVRDSFNDEMGYVLICHDIERQLRMETTLQSIERMRALGQLAAGIAHQINNYTNAIYGSTDLLNDTLSGILENNSKEAEEVDSYLQLIRKSIQRLTGLTQHLTTFARAQQPLVISPGNVNKIITELVSLLSSQAGKKEISLETKLDDKLPDIPFSPLHLEQALLNIIMNSMDAITEKTGTILVTTYDDKENIYISVKDNGPGIPEEIKDLLFEAFVTTKPAGVGTGLGLNIAKNVIESLKGDITVDTDSNGTNMIMRIPIHNEEVIS